MRQGGRGAVGALPSHTLHVLTANVCWQPEQHRLSVHTRVKEQQWDYLTLQGQIRERSGRKERSESQAGRRLCKAECGNEAGRGTNTHTEHVSWQLHAAKQQHGLPSCDPHTASSWCCMVCSAGGGLPCILLPAHHIAMVGQVELKAEFCMCC